MSAPAARPARRPEWRLWTLTAVLALGGLALGCGLVPPTSRIAQASAADAPPRAPDSVVPTPASEPQDAERFRTRMLAFAPLQAALRRAFAPPPARIVLARTHPAGAKVRAGATPQACLAQAVYYEARGEPEAGQAAVAQVVLNRTRSGVHPSSVCGVVFEGARRPGCQFSFACDPRLGGRRPDPASWRRAEQVAAATLAGHEAAGLRQALNYHADSVRPGWAGRLQRAAEIGRHIFYAALPPRPPTPAYAASE